MPPRKKGSTIEEIRCTSCGERKKGDFDFYVSFSRLNRVTGRMSVCKTCVAEAYTELYNTSSDARKALFELCRLLDIVFKENMADTVIGVCSNSTSNVAQTYITKVNSLKPYKNLTFMDSDMVYYAGGSLHDELIAEMLDKEKMTITRDMILRWGNGLSFNDYEWLENRYHEWVEEYGDKTLSLRTAIKDIVEVEKLIRDAKLKGDIATFTKLTETRQKLLGDAEMKPSQNKGVGDEDAVSVGTKIRDYEKRRPIPDPDPEYEDPDHMSRYIYDIFIKNLKKVFGFGD